MPYVILVDDNYHYMDNSYRCRDGEFATAEEALARCRQIVDEYLDDAEKIEGRGSATKLWESYKMFGEDPRGFPIGRDRHRSSSPSTSSGSLISLPVASQTTG